MMKGPLDHWMTFWEKVLADPSLDQRTVDQFKFAFLHGFLAAIAWGNRAQQEFNGDAVAAAACFQEAVSEVGHVLDSIVASGAIQKRDPR